MKFTGWRVCASCALHESNLVEDWRGRRRANFCNVSTAAYLPTQTTIGLQSTQPRVPVIVDASVTKDASSVPVPENFAAVLRETTVDAVPSGKSSVDLPQQVLSGGNLATAAALASPQAKLSMNASRIVPSVQERMQVDSMQLATTQPVDTAQTDDAPCLSDTTDSLPAQIPSEQAADPKSTTVVSTQLGSVANQTRAQALYAAQAGEAEHTAGAADAAKLQKSAAGPVKLREPVKHALFAQHTKCKSAERGDHQTAGGQVHTAVPNPMPVSTSPASTPAQVGKASTPENVQSGPSLSPATAQEQAIRLSTTTVAAAAPPQAAATQAQAAANTAPVAMEQIAAPAQVDSDPQAQESEGEVLATKANAVQLTGRAPVGHGTARCAAKKIEASPIDVTQSRSDDASGAVLKSGSATVSGEPLGKVESSRSAERGPMSDHGIALQNVTSVDVGSAMRSEDAGRRGPIEMRIDDAALGPVHVQATFDGSGGVHIGIAGQRDDAHAALEQIAPLLHAAVSQQAESHGSMAASVHVLTGAERAAESTGTGLFPTVRMSSGDAQVIHGDAFTGGFDGAAQQRPGQQHSGDSSRQARVYRQEFEEGSGNGRALPVAVGFSTPAAWNNVRSGGLSVRI